MSPKSKFWTLSTLAVALITILLFLFNVWGVRDKTWYLIKPDLIAENAHLKNANERLVGIIESLKKQNKSLKRILEAYENNFFALKDAAKNCSQMPSMLPIDLPAELTLERFEIRQIYRQMLAEKKRWDRYQQEKYKNILERTVEPVVAEIQGLNLENQDNIDYFLELDSALKLHRRLIRDVRVFHDEIKFQKKQLHAQPQYALYDIKFELNDPFARDSALVDALQQAMSALSAGIFEQEAVEVLDRIGDAFTRPIQQLYEQQLDTTDSPLLSTYNYNFSTLFGKKLLDYTDTLTQQSDIPLGLAAFGELDFFNRRISESLYDLYQVGQDEAIDPNYLDVVELEQILDSRP